MCSSVRFPGKQSAAAWGSSHSSSHWAATASCCSSPHLQVHINTPIQKHGYMPGLSNTHACMSQFEFCFSTACWKRHDFRFLVINPDKCVTTNEEATVLHSVNVWNNDWSLLPKATEIQQELARSSAEVGSI